MDQQLHAVATARSAPYFSKVRPSWTPKDAPSRTPRGRQLAPSQLSHSTGRCRLLEGVGELPTDLADDAIKLHQPGSILQVELLRVQSEGAQCTGHNAFARPVMPRENKPVVAELIRYSMNPP